MKFNDNNDHWNKWQTILSNWNGSNSIPSYSRSFLCYEAQQITGDHKYQHITIETNRICQLFNTICMNIYLWCTQARTHTDSKCEWFRWLYIDEIVDILTKLYGFICTLYNDHFEKRNISHSHSNNSMCLTVCMYCFTHKQYTHGHDKQANQQTNMDR